MSGGLARLQREAQVLAALQTFEESIPKAKAPASPVSNSRRLGDGRLAESKDSLAQVTPRFEGKRAGYLGVPP